MDPAPTLSYLSGMSATVFIAAGLVIAVVRWFHMCRPFDRNPHYYYPGRPYVAGIYLNALVLLSWAKRFNADDFSNPADFPVTTARRWIILVVVNVVLCWVAAISASQAVMAVMMLLFALASVLFIITALHPHRSRPVEAEAEPETASKAARRGPSKKKQQEILAAIHTVVVEQEAYLDAHLTIQDVADRSGYSRSSLSGLFKAEFGGFFPYVNKLRLQHVETYLLDHPDAALESGFNSRQAYYAVKSRIQP